MDQNDLYQERNNDFFLQVESYKTSVSKENWEEEENPRTFLPGTDMWKTAFCEDMRVLVMQK